MFDWRSRESLLIGARLRADCLTSKDTNPRAIENEHTSCIPLNFPRHNVS